MTLRPALILVTLTVMLLVALSLGFNAYRSSRPAPPPPPDNRPALPLRMRGVAVPAVARDAYDGEAVRASIGQAQALGADWVALVPTWYVSTATSCDLAPDPEKTVTDAGLFALLRDLDGAKLQVLVQPRVDVRDASGGHPGGGGLRPHDEHCFFDAYRTMVRHYADLAESGGADLLALGTQLTALSGPRHAIFWRELASAVRRQFQGRLTYAAAWGTDERAEYRRIDWWDAVDFVGVDAFFPLSTGAADHEAGADEDFARAWQQFPIESRRANWVEEVHAVSRRFNRFVILTALGYRSAAESARTPWDATAPGPVAVDLQARLFAAARSAWEREFWLEGVFVWAWEPNPNAGGPNDPGYAIQGKPAAEEVRRWFARR